jgi:hypothetical protein
LLQGSTAGRRGGAAAGVCEHESSGSSSPGYCTEGP